ncbi:SDR family oxidoreductase [Williamsia sp. 1135]|uniref:SDR family NAD(P)-dependent oxidoreductase n=1 Tax=Williamsia sp. 1135 TaxID=1889262 RepID=UPI000A10F15E|nr:SDR family oxidoreductase [Williamsia sp. 1135]ORM27743.1 short-chain dehydrogenase [Williamsia sp. 1135]
MGDTAVEDSVVGERKAALVTGASRGIGAEVATRFAEAGWDLTISARSREPLEQLAQLLGEKFGVRVTVAVADMADAEQLEALAAAHNEAFGRLDLLVLNAGMGQKGPIAELPVRRFDKLYQVNVRSAYVLLQALLPTLRRTAELAGAAKVVAIASITGVHPEPELAAYGATKAALISLCETFNLEESDNGVSATTISPGYVNTDMSDWLKDKISPDEMITVGDVATMVEAVSRLSRYAVLPGVVLTRPGTNLGRA